MAHKPPLPPAPLFRMVRQRHTADCGVACLAMFTGLRYEDVLTVINKPVVDVGMTVKDIRDTAARLKHPVRLRRKIDLDSDSGILGIRHPDKTEHVAILHDGKLYDTDGCIWDVDDYFADGSKATSLLTRK